MSEFLSTFWRGKVTFSLGAGGRISYDRCNFGRWDYYVFHCGIFSVMVSA